MTASRRGRADGRANRERVLAAARDVFREQGNEAEMRRIAELAGVGIATLYRGYGNKEGLLLAVCDDATRELMALLDTAIAADDATAGLRRFLIDAVVFASEWGPVFEVFAQYPAAKSWPWSADLAKGLRGLILEGVGSGRFTATANVDAVVHLILGAIISIAHTRDAGSAITGEELADTVLALIAERG